MFGENQKGEVLLKSLRTTHLGYMVLNGRMMDDFERGGHSLN